MTFTDEQRIPETCRERFLPLSEPALGILRSAGLFLGGLSDLCEGYLAQRPACRTYHIVAVVCGEVARSSTHLKAGELFSTSILL